MERANISLNVMAKLGRNEVVNLGFCQKIVAGL